MTNDDQDYLIWSNQHGRWWGPNSLGYTTIISEAGRYARRSAEVICANANIAIAEGAEPDEVMVLAPEAIDKGNA